MRFGHRRIAGLGLAASLGLLAGAAGCAAKRCVTNCDADDDTDDDTAGSSGGAGLDAACRDATDEAAMFIAQNNACETLLDCTAADGFCYRGPLAGDCGGVGLSTSADLEAWAVLTRRLQESCECGAPPCGAQTMCNADRQCEVAFASEAFCPNLQRDIEAFLAANRACQTDADCMFVPSVCHVDDCSGVVLNTDANVASWQRLDYALATCDTPEDFGRYCNYVGECGFTLVCNQGQCGPLR